MPRLSPEYLSDVATRILVSLGTPPDIAARVSEALVNADLAGHSSHGVMRIPSYVDDVAAKKINVAARPTLVRETPSTAVMDVGHGWGHFAADRAMSLALSKAKESGIGAVSLSRCSHVGRLGEYVEAATREGCVGMVTVGYGGRGLGWSAPYGGKEKVLMTNPIAIGVPVADGSPFVLDFATTTASRGKVRLAGSTGETLPEGWILDAQGRPSTRPEDFFNGGYLTHMGAHKGYALSLATCLLGGLSGAFQAEHARMGGVFLQAIRVSAFQPVENYARNVEKFLSGMRSSHPVEADKPVQVPGDVEARSRRERTRNGIDVPEHLWEAITRVIRDRNIEVLEGATAAAVDRR